MSKRLGYIAFWKGGYPVCDSAGDAVLFPTMEDAEDFADAPSYAGRTIEKTYGVVKVSGLQRGPRR